MTFGSCGWQLPAGSWQHSVQQLCVQGEIGRVVASHITCAAIGGGAILHAFGGAGVASRIAPYPEGYMAGWASNRRLHGLCCEWKVADCTFYRTADDTFRLSTAVCNDGHAMNCPQKQQ